MPSNDLQGDVLALYTEHRQQIITAGGVGIVLLLLLLLFGGFNAIGGIIFLGYALVWLAVLGVVLWLAYRFVSAVERIAAAQERMASARDHEAVGTTSTDSDPSDATGDEFVADESTPGVDDEAGENE